MNKFVERLKNIGPGALVAAAFIGPGTVTTATKSGANKILFAVSVGDGERDVRSLFDLELTYSGPFTPADELFFFVGDKHVKDVNNRFANNSVSLENPGTGTPLYAEKTWSGTPATAASGTNTVADASDNRSLMPVYPAIQGKPIKIRSKSFY